MDIHRHLECVLHEEIQPVLAGLDTEAFARAVDLLTGGERIFLAGAGRSGLIMRMFAMRLSQMGRAAFVVGETTTPSAQEEDLLVIASGSGRTAGMQSIADIAKAEGVRLLSLTYAADSPLAKTSDHALVIPVPRDSSHTGGLASRQVLGTLFDQCLVLTSDLLIAALVECAGESDREMSSRHANLE